jgi:hypothetical protein
VTAYELRIFDERGRQVDTLDGYTLEGAEEHASWEVQHNGVPKVEIVREDGTVVATVTPGAPR